MHTTKLFAAHLRATIQGAVSGLHGGLGLGLGAMLGGVLYASLGARRCFAVCASLPSLSLLLLVLPTVRHWRKSPGVGGRQRTTGLVPRKRHGGDDGRMYELVGNVSTPGSINDSLFALNHS